MITATDIYSLVTSILLWMIKLWPFPRDFIVLRLLKTPLHPLPNIDIRGTDYIALGPTVRCCSTAFSQMLQAVE
jgi:hypothetical protein